LSKENNNRRETALTFSKKYRGDDLLDRPISDIWKTGRMEHQEKELEGLKRNTDL
jgi:hypothetical protein